MRGILQEPKDPMVRPSEAPLSEEEQRFHSENLIFKAPMEFLHRYQQLIFDYHDVCSKSKFDIGCTYVIEHKVMLNSPDPINVRQQVQIPFEHRQTIYDWVDKLLKKGAIEVSISCFNSPIFLDSKPHGHGKRALLDIQGSEYLSLIGTQSEKCEIAWTKSV